MYNNIGEQIEALRLDCERREVHYKTIISTHEVTIGQQAIELNNLKQDSLRVQGNLAIAGRAERDNAQEAWDIVDEQVLEIKNLLMDVKKLQDEQVMLDVNTSAKRMDTCPCCNSNVDIYGEALQEVLMDSCTFCPCFECGGEQYLTDDSLILQYTGVIEAGDNPFPGNTTQTKKLDEVPFPVSPRVKEQLAKAQEVVSDNVNTILRLQGEIKDLGQVNSYLMDERDSLFNALLDTDPEYAPEPYPYTHPVRDVSDYSKVNRGLGMDVMVPAYMVK